MAVSPCCKVLPCSSFFWQKVSNKRQIRDWCIFLLKNAENEKKRLNLASEWRLFDSLGEHEQFTVKKWRNLQPKNREIPKMIFLFHSNLVQKGNVVWTKEIQIYSECRFLHFFSWNWKIHSWTQKNGELSNQKKSGNIHSSGENGKITAEKKNREFVQPKKIMEKSPFRMEISAFFWWNPKNRNWKKMEKSATQKKWMEKSPFRNKKMFSSNYFWSKKHSWFANKHVKFQKKWMEIHSGKK